MYRTGDLVAWGGDNSLEYHGRGDHQIKIRGFRVELGEIESSLLRLEGVHLAAARFFAESPMGPCLVADYTGDDSAPDPDQALAFLKQELPSYMVPAKIIRRDQLPVTASGKVDRNALPEPEFVPEAGTRASAGSGNLNRTEQEVAEIWAGLLGRPANLFEPQSDFFLMGGHSLLLMQMIVALRKDKGLEISLPVFLQRPTIEHLAELLQGRGEQGDRSIELALADAHMDLDWLPDDPRPMSDKPGIVLTGAAGFIGSHILEHLLSTRGKPVIALVRAKEGLTPARTLDKALEQRGIEPGPEGRRNLAVFDFDLARPDLGLDSTAREYIAANAGHIFHCGAMVNHLYGYAQHRPANVLGVVNLLRLAVETGMGRFDFISTTAARTPDGSPESDWSGYVLSKWTGEQLCRRLRGHGVDSRILRVGYVTGHSGSGLVDQDRNHLSLLIRSFVETGVAPDWRRQLEVTPVDHLVHEIAEAISNPRAANGDWDLSGTLRLQWAELVELVRKAGYPVRMISHQDWYREHLQKAESGSALHLLKGLYTEQSPEFAPPPENNFQDICRRPAEHGDVDPADLFRLYLEYFSKTGFISGHD